MAGVVQVVVELHEILVLVVELHEILVQGLAEPEILVLHQGVVGVGILPVEEEEQNLDQHPVEEAGSMTFHPYHGSIVAYPHLVVVEARILGQELEVGVQILALELEAAVQILGQLLAVEAEQSLDQGPVELESHQEVQIPDPVAAVEVETQTSFQVQAKLTLCCCLLIYFSTDAPGIESCRVLSTDYNALS